MLTNINERKITNSEIKRAQELQIGQIKEEQRMIQRNLLLDSILNNRATL